MTTRDQNSRNGQGLGRIRNEIHSVDHTLLRRLQVQVGDRLEAQLADRSRQGQGPLTEEGIDALKAELAHRVVEDYANEVAEQGMGSMSWEDMQDIIQGLKNKLYGAGSLEALLRDERLEEIDINGHQHVFVDYTNGVRAKVPPVFASNEELIETISTLAAHEGLSGRSFDSANPHVNFRLGSARVQAVMAVSTVPVVSIRLHHRHMRYTLKDLVANGTIDQPLADFFAAAVRAKKNLIIGGETSSGKALALDTPIPTPAGWTTMGELRTGDWVFDDHGRPCEVTKAHAVLHDRPCFEVEFSTGEVIVADSDHLWEVTSRADRKRRWEAKPTPGLTRDERALLEIAELAGEEVDRQVTVTDLADEVGPVWKGSLQRIARTLVPGGNVVRTFQRGGPTGNLDRRVATYSRQQLLKELVVARVKVRPSPQVAQVRTTEELAGQLRTGRNGERYLNWQVKLAGPLQYPRKDLPIDPYVLGIWLGDGTSRRSELTTADEWVADELTRLGYPARRRPSCGPYAYGVGGELQAKLRVLGLIQNKHIPRVYLEGDPEQRMALLQGLLDSDGTTAKQGCVEFAVTDHRLAAQAHELVVALGYRANLTAKACYYEGAPFGTVWTVRWVIEDQVFRLPRKDTMHAERTRHTAQARARRAGRTIVDIRPCASAPVRCITVDSPNHLYLAGRGCVPTHNTVLLRALAHEIDPVERLITIERALELGLEDDVDAHPDIIPMEERLANAEGEGAVPMRELLMVSKRMRPDRVIVGEVLGDEILVMLNAMMQGNDGSLSTIHANSSEGITENICSYAVQAPERLPRAATIGMIANGLDFLVFMRRYRGDGQQRRVVHSVREISSYDQDGLKTNEIFAPGPDGMAVRKENVVIKCLEALREAGYRDTGDPIDGTFDSAGRSGWA